VACTTREFSEEVARCLKLPAPKPIPGLVSRLLLGALAETVSANCRVTNAKLRAFGWQPRYPSYREGVPASIAALERGDVLP